MSIANFFLSYAVMPKIKLIGKSKPTVATDKPAENAIANHYGPAYKPKA